MFIISNIVKYRKVWATLLYPLQNVHRHGTRMFPVPNMFARLQSVDSERKKLGWVLCSLLLSSQSLWTCIENSTLYVKKWHGWFLTYLSIKCLRRNMITQQKSIFNMKQIKTRENLLNKIDALTLSEALEDVKGVMCINLNEFEYTEDMTTLLESTYCGDIIASKEIIIIENYVSNDHLAEEIILYNNNKFQLHCICQVNDDNNRLQGEIYARHGNYHTLWWYQKHSDNIRYQRYDINLFDILTSDTPYILLYCRQNGVDMEKYRTDYLTYLGGQKKIKCGVHNLSLISSYQKNNICQKCLENYEYYTCPNLECKICICRRCFLNIGDNDEVRLIAQNNNNHSVNYPSNDNEYHLNDNSMEESSVETDTQDSHDTEYFLNDGMFVFIIMRFI